MIIHSKNTNIYYKGVFFKFVSYVFTGGAISIVLLIGAAWYIHTSAGSTSPQTRLPAPAVPPLKTLKRKPTGMRPSAPAPEQAGEELVPRSPDAEGPVPPQSTMLPASVAIRPDRSPTPQPELDDTAARSTNVTIPLAHRKPSAPKPLAEVSGFARVSCNLPRSCPVSGYRGERQCDSVSSSLFIDEQRVVQLPRSAREHTVRGEVKLDVVFGADSRIHLRRVLQSLGYELDKSALDAVDQLRFTPAIESGCPIDVEHTLVIPVDLSAAHAAAWIAKDDLNRSEALGAWR
jgi:TonB family protein